MAYTPRTEPIKKFVLEVVPQCYLPAIQRELVWDTDRIENLFDSILRGYPFGTLLLWNVREEALRAYSFYSLIDQFDASNPHNKKANLDGKTSCLGILDGQQRTTALFLGLKGSYREKLPHKRHKNPEAWVTRRLYLNLLHVPDSEEDRRFDFQFLDDKKAQHLDSENYWFRAGEILNFKNDDEVRTWRKGTEYRDSDVFENNLSAFWKAITSPAGINYFEEDNQDLNEVLTIFVRLNMGGLALSHSDLLLSLATATWSSHDAREAVYNMVEKINRDCGKPFGFDKNFVLKVLLVLNGHDVRFRTENIQRDRNLEQTWDRVAQVLPTTIRLVAQFGLNREIITASNAIIPIAYYLNKSGHTESYLASKHSAEDRERIRRWLLVVLIGRVFGRQSDQLLSALRKVIDGADVRNGFPAEAMLASLRQSQALAVSREAIEVLVDEATYGSSLAYQLLALLRSGTVEAVSTYHVDHLHPYAHFTSDNMVNAGWSDTARKAAEDDRNRLPNLQLLEGAANQSKSKTPLADWLRDMETRDEGARTRAFIPVNADLAFAAFPTFYSSRRQLLIDELCSALLSQPRRP
jgi:uncharacterized protein with ParB-like and HNH nuclease domain